MTPAAAAALSDNVAEFLSSLTAERGLAPSTVAAYRRDLQGYVEYLASREPTPELVSGFFAHLRERGLSPNTVARRMSAVRGFHRFLVAEGMADVDPTRLLDNPKRAAALPKALTVEETFALLEAPDPSETAGRRDAALLEFLYGTGARVAEAVAVDELDLDLEERVVVLTGKGSKQRLVPMGSGAVGALRAWLPDRMSLRRRSAGGALFLNLRGGRLSRQGVWEIVKKAALRAGLPAERVSPHVLRHSAATHMVEGGADLRTVQEILGHATISTTQIYTRVSPRHLVEVHRTTHPRS
jgi:integrase/recombinase XerD